MPIQVSGAKGVMKLKKLAPSEMSFLSRILIPVCMKGLVIPTTLSRAAVRVSGAMARSASCEDEVIFQTCRQKQYCQYQISNIFSKRGNPQTHPSHHLSNHPVPVAVLVLSAVRFIFYQLHFVLKAHFFGYFRQQVHAKTFQLVAFGHGIWLLL